MEDYKYFCFNSDETNQTVPEKLMCKRRCKYFSHRHIAVAGVSVFTVLTLCAVAFAQQTLPEKHYKTDTVYQENSAEQFFSPSAAGEFYQIAHQTSVYADIKKSDWQEAQQAIVLLAAAANLDARAVYFLPDIINIASGLPQQDYSQLLFDTLTSYVDESSDIEIARKAFRCLLEKYNSREDREKFLTDQLKQFTGRNLAVESEIATTLGLFAAEKADVNSALTYFARAYNSNRYNRLAFAKIVELSPEQISAPVYLEHLRLLISENPLDMQSALAFAQQSQRLGLYDNAADAYQYCADLFNYLEPAAQLPPRIYLPLAICSYNSTLSRNKCIQLAKRLRQNGQFDLLAETIAAKAAEKAGDTRQAETILRQAENNAIELLNSRQDSQALAADYAKLAWFYCFAVPQPDKALDFANKAYSTEPNSQMTAALLAYTLVLNDQHQWAKSIIDTYPDNQISLLALAQIQLADANDEQAIETLKNTIAKDPASFEAEKAKRLLAEHGGTYIPPADPDMILATLKSRLGESMSLRFIPPEKIIAVQLNTKGTKFSYGADFGASITITNNSPDPLVISDDGLFTGRIRIDAIVTGNIEAKIPNAAVMRIYPSTPILPGRSTFIPFTLAAGELKDILMGHPQASLNIELAAYLDPVTAADGKITNNLPSVAPAKITVTRSATEISPKYLQNRLNSLAHGQQGQKIKTIELITGLLKEQQELAKGVIPYKLTSADWMTPMLTSALAQTLADDDWVVRVHTMSKMLSLALDYELTNAVSENLNDTRWPCRLMAQYLLAKNTKDGFKKVLDWNAKNDPNKFVRDMAVALGGAKPPEEKTEQTEKTQPRPTTPATGRISEPNSK